MSKKCISILAAIAAALAAFVGALTTSSCSSHVRLFHSVDSLSIERDTHVRDAVVSNYVPRGTKSSILYYERF